MNPNLPTGEIEVVAAEAKLLNRARSLPFQIDGSEHVAESTRLKYRYLDLRRPEMQERFRFRHRLAKAVRDYLDQHGFLEIETPVLTKSTPEGARDYLVPSRVTPGHFYALPQSPQLFKQILMVAGFDRYYQIVRCFRDEDLRADRQPEFTQIDLEMSFVQPDDVIAVTEGMLAAACALRGIEVPRPIPRLTYADAMRRFGIDRPGHALRPRARGSDRRDCAARSSRCSATAVEKGGIVKVLRIPEGERLSRKDLDDLPELVAPYGARGVAWVRITDSGWQSPIAKFLTAEERAAIEQTLRGAGEGDLLLFVAAAPKVANDALANLRLKLAEQLGMIPGDRYAFVWVTDFPLFEYSRRRQAPRRRAPSVHRAARGGPRPPRIRLRSACGPWRTTSCSTAPSSAAAASVSIGRRSSRASSSCSASARAKRATKFGFLLDALAFGAPPHGGIAFGLDRIAMLLSGGTRCATSSRSPRPSAPSA